MFSKIIKSSFTSSVRVRSLVVKWKAYFTILRIGEIRFLFWSIPMEWFVYNVVHVCDYRVHMYIVHTLLGWAFRKKVFSVFSTLRFCICMSSGTHPRNLGRLDTLPHSASIFLRKIWKSNLNFWKNAGFIGFETLNTMVLLDFPKRTKNTFKNAQNASTSKTSKIKFLLGHFGIF